MSEGWLDPSDWWPAGQGRSFELTISRDALIAAVEAVANRADDEFDVIVCELHQAPGEKEFHSGHHVVALREVLAGKAINQFLRSKQLTRALPEVPPSRTWNWASACSLNGLILVQRGGSGLPPRLGVVPRVEHRETGKRVEHTEYDKLFRAIKRKLQQLR